MCKFKLAWTNGCLEKEIEGSDYCEKHSKMKCCSCGEQATHECEETNQFVCGAPLCENCEDEISYKGTNTFRHVKKVDQKYTSWFMRTEEDNKKLLDDMYLIWQESSIESFKTVEFLTHLEKYECNKLFIDDIKERIKRKENQIYDYMKEHYPSSIIKKEE